MTTVQHAQFQKLADISADIGQVALASIAIPFFLDSYHPLVALLGVAVSFTFWTLSLLLIKQSHS